MSGPVSGIIAIFAILTAPPSSTSPTTNVSAVPTPSAPSSAAPVELGLQELIVADASGGLKPSAKALELDGKRVRVIGFIADLEEASRGGFYLCALPVHGDESGGGLGDLPAHAIAVHLPTAKNLVVPPHRGRVIVTGIFHVGASVPPDNFIGAFHITADLPTKPVAAKNNRRKPVAATRRKAVPTHGN